MIPDPERQFVVDVAVSGMGVALEEWRYWLEGAKPPFLVWADHKSLKYISSAKRLSTLTRLSGPFF